MSVQAVGERRPRRLLLEKVRRLPETSGGLAHRAGGAAGGERGGPGSPSIMAAAGGGMTDSCAPRSGEGTAANAIPAPKTSVHTITHSAPAVSLILDQPLISISLRIEVT